MQGIILAQIFFIDNTDVSLSPTRGFVEQPMQVDLDATHEGVDDAQLDGAHFDDVHDEAQPNGEVAYEQGE